MKNLISILFVCCLFFTQAQNSYRFHNYTLNQGLSQSVITSIIQDEVGALWIGTQDGLNRFDGQSFENFSSDNTEGIKNEYIHASIVGKDQKLWFGTANGLICYNALMETFKNYPSPNNSALQIESLVEDTKGNIWIGSASSGLFVLKKGASSIQPYKSGLNSSKIQYITLADENNLFVSTEDKGLFRINLNSKVAYAISIQGKHNPVVHVNIMRKLKDDKWLVGSNQGLYILNEKEQMATSYLPELDDNYGVVDISDILVETEKTFFLATKSQGLLTVSTAFHPVQISQNINDHFQINSLLHNTINVLFKDKTGTFWVGTNRGLGSFDPINAGFYGIGTSTDLTKGIPSANVWCFGEDPLLKYVFIGTDNAISQFNRKTGKFRQFVVNTKEFFGLENGESSILSLSVVSEKEILLGTTDGLLILKISDSGYKFEKIKIDHIKNYLNFSRIYTIVHWKEQKYFLATKGGVLLYDKAKNSFTVFEHDPHDKRKTISPGTCRFAYKDLEGNVWFTTSTGGLNILKDKKDKLFIVPSPYNTIVSSKSKDYITGIKQVSSGVYWLGTMGSGIIKLDVVAKTGKLLNKKNGLPNNVIYGILQDKSRNLWLSTNKGISKFNPSNERFHNYTEMDGLMSNEFNQGAYFESKTGEFYFGGINGYNYFNPENLNNRSKKIDVSFIKLKLDGDWLKPNPDNGVLKQSISSTTHLDLSYKQRSFTIKMMAIDLSNPELVTYKYILEGSNEGEIHLGSFNQIHFTSLSPGEYELKAYARIGNGPWSDNPATLEIFIAAPFWQKLWFWIVAAIVIAITVTIYIRRRIDNERREQVRLEMKIAERTREIRTQNVEIEKQKKTIEEKNNKLEEQKSLLENEKIKTEKLLKNIIPESTYEELKTKGKASARAYTTVSVMFTDFVGFTKIAEKMTPTELVNELDIYFRKFDEIIVANNLEKIKTMGDAYMCAGGVPVRNNTNPIDTCLAALQIQENMTLMRAEAERSGRTGWDLRLGINTGEITAGVIGSKKLAYDIWGSTVNRAHRMEMLGEPGKVTISGNTFKFIEPYFVCTFRGKIRSKSKELIDMYTVEGIKPELSIDGKGLYPNQKFKEIVNLHFYSSINYYKAERHIIRVLEKRLSQKLHYHSIAHTKDVCEAIERLALSEGITDEALFLLKSAATYHDAGFVEQYEKNEPIGARMAEEILPEYGYSPHHIDQIKTLIYVTQIPHTPKNHLEEIMCDADLDYLGRSDFHEISDRLRMELREHGKLNSDREWDQIQVKFFNAHKYFTKTAKDSRDQKKAQNLEEIKARLLRDEYKD